MAHHKMHVCVLGVLEANKVFWQNVPAITAARNQLSTGIKFVTTLQEAQAGITTGITGDKKSVRRQLCESAVLVGGAVAALADSQNNHELYDTVDFTLPALLHESEENCKAHCANILKAGTANLAALVAVQSLAQTDLDALQTLVTAFDLILTRPRQAKVDNKGATDLIPTALLANDRTLERQLDKLMERYRNTQPVFFQAYQAARVIVDIGAHPSQTEEPPAPTASAPLPPPAQPTP